MSGLYMINSTFWRMDGRILYLLTWTISLFGQANTQYDFSTGNIDQLRAKAQELEKSQAASKKNLNPKAIAMIEQYALSKLSYH